MREKWMRELLEANKELLLIFTIVAFAAVINFFVSGQRLVLTFYNLPTLFAVYYFGRARAMQEFSFRVFEAFATATVIYLLTNLVVVLLMRALEQKVRVPGLIATGGAPQAGH